MGAASPPYIPKYGNGAPAAAAPQGTLYFDIQNNYQPYIRQGGQWHNAGNLLLGAGVPAFVANAGVLWSRNDGTAGLYQSTPALAAPVVVQEAHAAGNSVPGTVTMGVAITAGNLLICFVGASHSFTPNAAGWNILDNGGQVGVNAYALYRYADGTEGTHPPNAGSATSAFWGQTVLEISGVTGNAGADIISHIMSQSAGATFNTTTPQATTSANQLCLLGQYGYNGTANFLVPAGWTNVDNWNDGSANYGAMEIAKQTPGSGTNVGNTLVTKPAGTNNSLFAETIILKAGLTAHWDLIGP